MQRKMKSSFSFPMQTWRVHGKSLLPTTRINGSQGSNMDGASSLPPSVIFESKESQFEDVTPSLHPTRLSGSQDSEIEVTTSLLHPTIWPCSQGPDVEIDTRHSGSQGPNMELASSSNLLYETSSSLIGNGQLSVSRKYQSFSKITANRPTCLDENSLTTATLPTQNLQQIFPHCYLGVDEPRKRHRRARTLRDTIKGKTTAAARMKLHNFKSEKNQPVKSENSVLDKRKVIKTSRYKKDEPVISSLGTTMNKAEGLCPIKVRRRVSYSSDQLNLLRYAFQQTNYLDYSLSKYIGNLLNLSPYSVKIWFQNERKKGKRMAKGLSNSSPSVDRIYSSSGECDLPLLNENQKNVLLPSSQETDKPPTRDPLQNPIPLADPDFPLHSCPNRHRLSEQDPLQLTKVESSIAAFFETLSNKKNDKNFMCKKKRKSASRSNVTIVPLEAAYLPVTCGNPDCDVATGKDVPTETASMLEEEEETLAEPSLSLDMQDQVADVKDPSLPPFIIGRPRPTLNSAAIDVKKDVDIKQEILEEVADFPILGYPNESKESVHIKMEVEDVSNVNEILTQIKEEVLTESIVNEAELLQEDDRFFIDTSFDALKGPSPSYVAKQQNVAMILEPETSDCPISKSPREQLKEEINIKSEILEEPVEDFEGAGPDVSEYQNLDQKAEEELEVFDGLQNLKLPLFTIQYPGDVSNPTPDCVISVAVIQPNSYGSGVVTLPNSADTEKLSDRRKYPVQRSREYACDMLVGVCLAKFKTWKHLEDHRKTHLRRGRNRKTYECFYYSNEKERSCDVTVSKKSTLEKHMREHHVYD